jgi:hypothetical protein
MKTEKFITERCVETKGEMLIALQGLRDAIEQSDWEEVSTYGHGFVIGACMMITGESFLED